MALLWVLDAQDQAEKPNKPNKKKKQFLNQGTTNDCIETKADAPFCALSSCPERA